MRACGVATPPDLIAIFEPLLAARAAAAVSVAYRMGKPASFS